MNTFIYNNITIKPAPQIDIKSEIIYANNNIIGYAYIITLTGKAIDDNPHFSSTISSIEFIRSTLSKNGSVLLIKDNNNNELIKAVGGILTDLQFKETDNSWSKYAEYIATIKFNELNILGETFDCNNNVFPNHSFSPNLINLNLYKLKEFSDSWNFTVADDMFNFVDDSDIKLSNSQINIEYNISASADHYFNDTSEVIAGWQQAKNFVQERLFEQIKNFRNNKNILTLYGNTSCDSSSTLSDIHERSSPGIVSTLSSYNIFNETISCSTSESEGTFSAKYNAILKYNDNDPQSLGDSKSIHTFNKTITKDFNGQKTNITIKIDGTIQGLSVGNFTEDLGFGGFALPKNGRLINSNNNFDKFANANIVKNKIIINDEDLTESFKEILKINAETLNPSNITLCSNTISPTSFSLTTNEFLGTINYSVTYTTDRNLATQDADTIIYKTSIDTNSPNPVYAEFPIPNGNYIIQNLHTFTSKKIKVSLNARKKRTECCLNPNNITITEIESVMNNLNIPSEEEESLILIYKNINFNLIDQSYTVSMEYICKKGCHI